MNGLFPTSCSMDSLWHLILLTIPKSRSLFWIPLPLYNGLPRHLIQFHHLYLSLDFALPQDSTFAAFILCSTCSPG